MTRKNIIELLSKKGYRPYGEEYADVFVRKTGEKVFVVTIRRLLEHADAETAATYIEGVVERYRQLNSDLRFKVTAKYRKPVGILNILLTTDGMFSEDVHSIVEQIHGIWIVPRNTNKIYVFENQSADFDGLYEYLSAKPQYNEKKTDTSTFRLTPVNITIVVLNVLAFLMVILLNGGYFAVYDTDIMLRMGAMSNETVMAGKWYQMITSMFLHFGIGHLANNMILLTYAGCQLEQRLGSLQYFILYFLSGIAGNVLSLISYQHAGEQVVSAGASGAIFGVIGALFVVLIINHEKHDTMTPKRLAILAILTIYNGMTDAGIDNAAHIGGLIGGLIGGFLLSKISQYVKLE